MGMLWLRLHRDGGTFRSAWVGGAFRGAESLCRVILNTDSLTCRLPYRQPHLSQHRRSSRPGCQSGLGVGQESEKWQ